jgi:transcription initiation factor TFIIB
MALNLKTIDDSKEIYYQSIGKITRLNKEGLIASCVYIACKKNNCPRSSSEISKLFKISKEDVNNGVKKLMIILNEKECKEVLMTSDKEIKPNDFINRFCSNLNIMNPLFVEKIKKTIGIATDNCIIDNIDESSVAAAMILFISQHCPEFNISVTKKQLQKQCNMSLATINRCLKLLEANKQLLN